MLRIVNPAGIVAIVLCCVATVYAQGRPAPPPSRYGLLAEDRPGFPCPRASLWRESRDALPARYFIANSADAPLVLNEIFQDGVLVSGTKLVSGKVYQYFPNGVPMEGKTHLKGWQAPFGDIKGDGPIPAEGTGEDLRRPQARLVEGASQARALLSACQV